MNQPYIQLQANVSEQVKDRLPFQGIDILLHDTPDWKDPKATILPATL